MSPVDDMFLSGSLDKTIRLWDLRSPNCQVRQAEQVLLHREERRLVRPEKGGSNPAQLLHCPIHSLRTLTSVTTQTLSDFHTHVTDKQRLLLPEVSV